MKTVKFYTLGCKVNLYETETLKACLKRKATFRRFRKRRYYCYQYLYRYVNGDKNPAS